MNADDFGFTSGVNRAIVKAHTDGVVTSTTLMANGPAFCEVKDLSQRFPELSIGCHLVLIDGEPVLSPARVPSLTQSDGMRRPVSGRDAVYAPKLSTCLKHR